MRAPKERSNAWERVLTRYFAALNIPLKWEWAQRRFTGVSAHEFVRFNSGNEANVWARMPEYVKRYEHKSGNKVVVFVTNRKFGDSVDDSMVVLRMGTFAPMIKAFVDADRERWVE